MRRKKSNDKESHVLEQALKEAYRGQEPLVADERWTVEVMRTIQAEGPLTKSIGSESFGLSVWRLVPLSGALIFVLAACMLYFGFVPEYDMARYFINDPIDFTLIESLGI